MTTGDDDTAWAEGWAFYKGDGGDSLLPKAPTDYAGWIQGFAAAVAEYGEYADETSIEAALARFEVIKPPVREELLQAAEQVLETSTEFIRWPALPLREEVS